MPAPTNRKRHRHHLTAEGGDREAERPMTPARPWAPHLIPWGRGEREVVSRPASYTYIYTHDIHTYIHTYIYTESVTLQARVFDAYSYLTICIKNI